MASLIWSWKTSHTANSSFCNFLLFLFFFIVCVCGQLVVWCVFGLLFLLLCTIGCLTILLFLLLFSDELAPTPVGGKLCSTQNYPAQELPSGQL